MKTIWKTYNEKPWILAGIQANGTHSERIKGIKLYQISNQGQVRIAYVNKDNEIEKIKDINQHWKGKTVKYLGIPAGPYVHRLVAEMFVENPNSHRYVIHLDGDLENNMADNLAWTNTCRTRIVKNN